MESSTVVSRFAPFGQAREHARGYNSTKHQVTVLLNTASKPVIKVFRESSMAVSMRGYNQKFRIFPGRKE